MYFTLQGVLNVLEATVVSIVAKRTGYKILDDTPWLILFAYTVGLHLWYTLVHSRTMPLFLNQFIRGGTFYNLAVWIL